MGHTCWHHLQGCWIWWWPYGLVPGLDRVQLCLFFLKWFSPYKMENAIEKVVAEWLELAFRRRPNGRWHLSGPPLQQADVHPFWQKWRLGWCTALLDRKHDPKATADVTAERHGKKNWNGVFIVWSWLLLQLVEAHGFDSLFKLMFVFLESLKLMWMKLLFWQPIGLMLQYFFKAHSFARFL